MGLKVKNPKDIKKKDSDLNEREIKLDNLLKDIKVNSISIQNKKDKNKK